MWIDDSLEVCSSSPKSSYKSAGNLLRCRRQLDHWWKFIVLLLLSDFSKAQFLRLEGCALSEDKWEGLYLGSKINHKNEDRRNLVCLFQRLSWGSENLGCFDNINKEKTPPLTIPYILPRNKYLLIAFWVIYLFLDSFLILLSKYSSFILLRFPSEVYIKNTFFPWEKF